MEGKAFNAEKKYGTESIERVSEMVQKKEL